MSLIKAMVVGGKGGNGGDAVEGRGAIFPTKINVIKADLSIQRDPEKILISKRRHVCR
jgi:hypothetical protein